jgi:hypothetical protein
MRLQGCGTTAEISSPTANDDNVIHVLPREIEPRKFDHKGTKGAENSGALALEQISNYHAADAVFESGNVEIYQQPQ